MRRTPFVLAGLAACTLAACGGSESTAPTVASPPPTSAVATTVATTLPTELVPGTDAGDEEYPEPTPAPTEPLLTTPIETAPPTTATPTTDQPPTSEPLAVQELVLGGDGVGSALFGTDPEAVLQYVTSILGSNTADTGWVAPDTFGFCPGNEVRRVDWGVLSLLFGDGSDFATGRRHFMAWEYGRVGGIGDEPVGLRTAGGVTTGSRIVDVFAEFPDASLIPGDDDLDLPHQFYVDESFSGWTSGDGDDDFVTVLFGGPRRCGG